MAAHTIEFRGSGETLTCGEAHSLLRSMEQLGRRGIPVGCRNGGCGVCKIRIISGSVERRVMSRAHVTAEEEQAGYALACRITPRSSLVIEVIGKMRKAFENIRDRKGN